MQVSLNRRHGQVGPLGEQFRSPDIPAGVVHDIRVLWPVPDRLADDAGYNAVWRALHELKSEAAADAVTHKKELADAEMIHQPQLVISKRTPRIIDIDGTSRIAAIGVALVHGYAAEVVLESFHGVYYCSRPIADSRVQAAARRNQKRKAAANFLITDANITCLVTWHRLRPLPWGLCKTPVNAASRVVPGWSRDLPPSGNLGHRLGELGLVQPRVCAVGRQEFGVRSVLDDLPVFHDQDHVGITDGRQPVRDHEARAALPQRRHRVMDQPLAARG